MKPIRENIIALDPSQQGEKVHQTGKKWENFEKIRTGKPRKMLSIFYRFHPVYVCKTQIINTN